MELLKLALLGYWPDKDASMYWLENTSISHFKIIRTLQNFLLFQLGV